MEKTNPNEEVNEILDNEVEETNEIEISNEDVQIEEQPKEEETPFLKVKFLQEEKGLSQEEAIQYAQKGMNYDHVKEELDNLKNHKGLKLLEKYANNNGFKDVDEYITWVEKYEDEQKAQNEIQEIVNQRGIDEETAKEIYEMNKIVKQTEKEKEEARLKQEQEEKQKQDVADLFTYFKDAYGRDIDPTKDIPDEVFAEAQKGISLKYAFMQYELKNMRTSNKVEKQNETTANASVGSITKTNVNSGSQFTQEQIDKMSPAEMMKHWNNPEFRRIAGL